MPDKTNPTAGQTPGLQSPPVKWVRVPEGNLTELTFIGRCVILPAATALTITHLDGTTFTFASGELAVGVIHSMMFQNIAGNTEEVIAGY